MTTADFTNVELPASVEAERAILGGILSDHEQGVAFEHVAAMLKPEDFSLDPHRRIYLAVIDLAAEGKPIAGVELLDKLRAQKQLEMVGGAAYLFDISEGALPTPSYLTSRASRSHVQPAHARGKKALATG